MSLQRKDIRAAMKAKLLGQPGSPPTFAGTNIDTNRSKPHWQGTLGALTIYTLAEVAEKVQEAPRAYRRVVRVAVEGFLSAEVGALTDDTLDEALAQVEAVLLADRFLDGLAEDVELSEVEVAQDHLGQDLVGDFRVMFDVTYIYDVVEGDPATVFEFITAATTWTLPPSIDPAGSDITLPVQT